MAFEGLQVSTIKSYLSGLSYLHRFYSVSNPVESFRVSQLLRGIERETGQTVKQRDPISLSLLHRLLSALANVVAHPYDLALFASLFTLAYYGCLRVGEVAISVEDTHTAKLDELVYVNEQGAPHFLLKMTSFKHSNGRTPVLKLTSRPCASCPVHWLKQYLAYRGPDGKNLYQFRDGKLVTRDHVMTVLRKALVFLGMDPSKYGTHSFRVGQCTDLAMGGYTDAQLRQIGRWRSDAFRLYVRQDLINC